MTSNPDINNDRNQVLLTLSAQINELTQAVAKALGEANPKDPVPRLEAPMHPLEQQVLELLMPGVAMTITELAKKSRVERSAVHYHTNRLILKDKVREIAVHKNRHKTFYVCLAEQVKVPGVET